MQGVLFVLLGLVAAVMADSCGPVEALKMKQQWAHAYGTAEDRVDFGLAVFKGLFAKDSETKALFKRVGSDNVHSGAFKAHVTRVLGGVDMCVSLLDDAPTLNAALTHLQGQHKERGINPGYFDELGEVLEQVVQAKLGKCYDSHAWQVCYDKITKGIKS